MPMPWSWRAAVLVVAALLVGLRVDDVFGRGTRGGGNDVTNDVLLIGDGEGGAEVSLEAQGGSAQGRSHQGSGESWREGHRDTFEQWLQEEAAALSSGTGNANGNAFGRQRPSPLDVRVSKAVGSRGYDKIRLSVVSLTEDARVPSLGSPFTGTRNEGNEDFFKYRWTHAYDLGSSRMRCSSAPASVFQRLPVKHDAECLRACSASAECRFYTFFEPSLTCELASSTCELIVAENATATYARLGRRVLHTSVVKVVPGQNTFRVGGVDVLVNHPAEDTGVSGIVWADPCVSERWIGCTFAKQWKAFNGSVSMIDAIMADPSIHFWQVLGDNLYDQDGRLTQLFSDQLSLQTKSKVLMTVPGNHDLYIQGYPPGDADYDQFGHGFMQFYAQDSVAGAAGRHGQWLGHGGHSKSAFDFSVDPDQVQNRSFHNDFKNKARNFLWYHKMGNLGFVGYAGAATLEESMLELREACAYFSESKPAFIFVLGHWNEAGDGCDDDMTVPAVRQALLEVPGCDVGDRLKFFDGHAHCNVQQGAGALEPVGWTIGGHGMDDLSCMPQYGFVFVDSSRDSKLRVYYFQEHTLFSNNYDAILQCVQDKGAIAQCTHLAHLWLETDL